MVVIEPVVVRDFMPQCALDLFEQAGFVMRHCQNSMFKQRDFAWQQRCFITRLMRAWYAHEASTSHADAHRARPPLQSPHCAY